MLNVAKITPCLLFDHEAEQAAQFYTSVFRGSKIVRVSRYGAAGQAASGLPAGSVMLVAFELDGLAFTAINGGHQAAFNQAVSFQVDCATQQAVDYYWEKLSEGGDASAQQCGWLKDKFGVSWQIVPSLVPALMSDPDTAKSNRAMQAMLKMKKLDIEELRRAAEATA